MRPLAPAHTRAILARDHGGNGSGPRACSTPARHWCRRACQQSRAVDFSRLTSSAKFFPQTGPT